MTKKLGKESAASPTPKNGFFQNRPKGKTEAETKSKSRRKPMIISHLTNGATVPAPKTKVKDWSVARDVKKPNPVKKAKQDSHIEKPKKISPLGSG